MTENIGRLLRRLMTEAPDGPLSITDLAKLTGKPRSTIHRHLRGGKVSETTIVEYARALGRSPEDRDRIARSLKQAAGYPTPSGNVVSDEIKAMVVELEQLDREQLDAVWRIIGILRRALSHYVSQ